MSDLAHVCLVVIGALIICAAIAWVASDNQAQQRENYTGKADSPNQPSIQPCRIRDWFRRCVGGQSIIANDHPNEEQHRATEQIYWRETLRKQWHLNIITLIAAGVGLVGLLILGLTLKQTTIATNATRREFELSERSWLQVVSVSTGKPVLEPLVNGGRAMTNLNIDLTINNFGKSPAIFGAAFTTAFWPFEEPYGKEFFEDKRASVCPMAADQAHARVWAVFPNQSYHHFINQVVGLPKKKTIVGKYYIYVMGCIVYGDSVEACHATMQDWSDCRVSPFCAMWEIKMRGRQIRLGEFNTYCTIPNSSYR